MKVVIIIPTYNERENIAPLVESISHQFSLLTERNASLLPEVLIVDDHSPDGTGTEVRNLQTRYPFLHLIEGEKCGLGAAYIRGMNHAVKKLDADVVFEMDADFSHRPEDIPRLLDAILDGADFVIGSRYVEGGSIPEDWGRGRRLNSWGGNFVARHAAGLANVRDCTAGFRAIRTSLLERIDLSRLGVKGYVFQVALLHAALQQGARVTEVPVDFVERIHGTSKLRLADIIEFVRHACLLRLQAHDTFVKFLLVGASGVGVNLGSFTWLLALGVTSYAASPIAVELAIISNFLFNNLWTFAQHKPKDPIHVRGLKFNLVSVAALVVNTLAFASATRAFPHLPPQFCQLFGILPAWFVNYQLNTRWTFRNSEQ